MPANEDSTPASWAGKAVPQGMAMNSSQTPMPPTIEAMAPWVVARRQYRPHTSGTKAPTSGTW
ncbi:hypothetical protein D3C72_1880390 [compost metagenome]